MYIFVRIILVVEFIFLVTSTSGCNNNWITFEGNCYLFVATKQTWFHAAKACQDQNAWLVNVLSQKEEDFLRNTIKRLHSHENPQAIGYWTGGNDLAVEGQWVWGYPSETTMTYTDWYPGEPNNVWYDKREEDCVALWGHDNHDYRWNDQPCDITDYYVCKTEDVQSVVG